MNATVEEILRSASDALVAVLKTELEAALSRLRDVEKQAAAEIEGCRLLTKAQTAALLGCSRRQLDRWIVLGVLPVVWLDRRPRFRPQDLTDLAERRKMRVAARASVRGRRVK